MLNYKNFNATSYIKVSSFKFAIGAAQYVGLS
jgi:hypothetical protein